MQKGERSKQQLITVAAQLFWRNGYAATGISQILQASQLPKGSFYYYFKSKKDLARAVVTYYENLITENFQCLALESTWPEFVEKIYQFLAQAAAEDHLGCPFATLGAELALNEPQLASVYSQAMEKIRGLFASVLQASGLREEKAVALSYPMQAIYQGKLLLFRISGEPKQLIQLKEELTALYFLYLRQEAEK